VDTKYGSGSIPTDCSGDHSSDWVGPDQDHPNIDMSDYTLPVFLMQHVGDTPEPAHDDPECVQPLSVLEAKLQDITTAYHRLPTHVRVDYAEESAPKAFVAEVNGLWAIQPTVTPTNVIVGGPITHSWYNHDVAVSNIWASVSDGSSVSKVMVNVFQGPPIEWVSSYNSTEPTSVKVTYEGKTVVSFAAIGGALNSVSDRRKVEVWVDKTPPVVTAIFSPAPNTYGWNNTNVMVQISATDAVSGVDTNRSRLTSQKFIAEGTNHLQANVWDVAGNLTGFNTNVLIDKTPPVITAAPDRTANSNGWYNAAVTVHYMATDKISGVRVISPDRVFQKEGQNLNATGSAEDYAGNTATANLTGINLDLTAPDLRVLAPPPNSIYIAQSNSVALRGEAIDRLSGIMQVVWSNDRGGSGVATGTNNWSIASVPLQAGTNAITLTAQDFGGNATTNTFTAVYGAPVLNAVRSANQIVLSWPAMYTNLNLEMATSLGGGAVWTPLSGASVVGGQLVLTNALTNRIGFFRLRGQ
jgi:hypothetical protein